MPRLNLPTAEQYIDAMLAASGHYVVAGRFYRDQDRAAIARRALAEQWTRDDARRGAEIRELMAAEQVA